MSFFALVAAVVAACLYGVTAQVPTTTGGEIPGCTDQACCDSKNIECLVQFNNVEYCKFQEASCYDNLNLAKVATSPITSIPTQTLDSPSQSEQPPSVVIGPLLNDSITIYAGICPKASAATTITKTVVTTVNYIFGVPLEIQTPVLQLSSHSRAKSRSTKPQSSKSGHVHTTASTKVTHSTTTKTSKIVPFSGAAIQSSRANGYVAAAIVGGVAAFL